MRCVVVRSATAAFPRPPLPRPPHTTLSYRMTFRKHVTKVEGNLITVDEPLPHSIDPKFGGGRAWVCEWAGGTRITEVGLEFLTLVSKFAYQGKFGTDDGGVATLDENGDERHARFAVYLDNSEHVWVRNVTAKHFWMGAVMTGESGREGRCVTTPDFHRLPTDR